MSSTKSAAAEERTSEKAEKIVLAPVSGIRASEVVRELPKL
jgi:hypothetical protein